jgi:hypothetical protein
LFSCTGEGQEEEKTEEQLVCNMSVMIVQRFSETDQLHAMRM